MLEYAACRKPIIAPEHPCIEEVFGPSAVARFRAGDADDLGRVIGSLLARKRTRQTLAETAYAIVRDRHSAAAARRQLLTAYGALVASQQVIPAMLLKLRTRRLTDERPAPGGENADSSAE